MHRLDRPVWESLTTAHRELSLGGELARRYRPDVNLFGSARDDGEDSQLALCALAARHSPIYLLQVPAIVAPAALTVLKRANGVQMVAAYKQQAVVDDVGIVPLGDDDAAEMLALAQLTEPGPFLNRTHCMGRFLGIRIGGRLAAMAGERFRFPGFTEVSGVCTHPDFRGRGLARRLSATVAAGIEARGDTPFLHSWSSNLAAIALYETLGFAIRAEVDVAVVTAS